MKVFDNINERVRDDLKNTIKPGSRISIAAACFSMYAYAELKGELKGIDELRFIFTEPTFVTEQAEKEKREFYIPRLDREQSLYGTEFEIKLRNELTQRAIARECGDWIRQKGRFKSNRSGAVMGGFFNIETGENQHTYMPIQGFTTVDIGCDRGNNAYNMVSRLDESETAQFLATFEEIWNDPEKLEDVTEEVIHGIQTAYNENSPELIYFLTLYHVFSEFLEDISEDVLPNDMTGFKDSKVWELLYDFQRDAVLGLINRLEKYNGCILADSVGLGKTFTALAVIKYYETRNKSVLVLCPKKLSENWNTYKHNYKNNPLAEDRLRYDVLFHTDLSRHKGKSNGLELEWVNWSNYDLIVIDESHNFRNGGQNMDGTKSDNRYDRLLKEVVRAGVRTKVLMLSATPVNNQFLDLKNQLALAYEGESAQINEKLDTAKSIDEIFRQAQMAFTEWEDLDPEMRTTESLLAGLDYDFFELLDSVTIARSRKHIIKYYDAAKIGKFPERKKPISERPKLTDLPEAIDYDTIYSMLSRLNLEIYRPSLHIFPSRRDKYRELFQNKNLSQEGREQGIRELMRINLLKRLESSVFSFRLTLQRIRDMITGTMAAIDEYENSGQADMDFYSSMEDDALDFDMDDQNTDLFSVGNKNKIALEDMDYALWREELEADADILDDLLQAVENITPQHDRKLQRLLEMIRDKIEHPINPGNKKILVFTAFSDTAAYLYDNVQDLIKNQYGLHSALITGTVEGRTTLPRTGREDSSNLNGILTLFSPKSKNKELLWPDLDAEIDVLIATDCISEGQNLQDCDYMINYDIHWNPVRIVQRFGRIDRIGSTNDVIQMVNFWPDMTLDGYINLKARVENRAIGMNLVATGSDDVVNVGENSDLEYRKQQLSRLQNEVVDMEDLSSGVSIMDLGLNEFRMDLIEYVKVHEDLSRMPLGMHAVVQSTEELPPGTIFVLKNRNSGVNIDHMNRIHPFYMVYIREDGEVVVNYLQPKKMLDTLRLLCRGQAEPVEDLCRVFNEETDDGRNMARISELLGDAIRSIVNTKEESDIDSLFHAGGTSAMLSAVSGLDDFELVTFLAVR